MKIKKIMLLAMALCALKNAEAASAVSAKELRNSFILQRPSVADLCKIIDETELTLELQKLFFSELNSALQNAISTGNFTVSDEVFCTAMSKLCTVLTEEAAVSDVLVWSGDPSRTSRSRFVEYHSSEISTDFLRLIQVYRATAAFKNIFLNTCSRGTLKVQLPDFGPWSFSAQTEIDIDVYVDAANNTFRLHYLNQAVEIDTEEGYCAGNVSHYQDKLKVYTEAFYAEHGALFQAIKTES